MSKYVRLIDANALKQDILDFENCPNGYSDVYDKERILGTINVQPTVKAIPIEWIKKKSLEFLMNRNFRWATDFQEVIDMWKVENNIPLFDDELKITREKENEID